MAFSSLFDPLYCQEEHLDFEVVEEEDERVRAAFPFRGHQEDETHFVSEPGEAEEEWAELLRSLLAKEEETHFQIPWEIDEEESYLRSGRREAAEWVARAAACHAFAAPTVVLAVNYLDRCFLSRDGGRGGGLRLQRDRPWMGRLSAVACLSLAAKWEETHVPLLLDLQTATAVEAAQPPASGEYVFESKTIRRMEFLVLSALGWRMNPVTPLSFVHHLLPKLYPRAGDGGGGAARLREVARRCEAVILAVIADCRWVRHSASVWAAAVLLHAMGEQMEPGNHRVWDLLNVPKEKVEECSQLILELVGGANGVGCKRKRSSSSLDCNYCSPPSPNGVIGSCFSCESSSSCDSWAFWPSSVSSSPELPPSKRPSCVSGIGDEEGGEDELQQWLGNGVFV